jgi:hypothetical protein
MRSARFVLFLLPAALAACGDPVHDDQVDALGPEQPGLAAGPYHRAGQPCTVCHGVKGPANLDFSLAGTAYQHSDSLLPLQNAVVKVVDSTGKRAFTGTNCVGNFYFQRSDFDPVWPVWTSVFYGDPNGSPMSTPIYRAGSCAACHADPADEAHVGHIYDLMLPVDQNLELVPCQ